jgi:uncharacterized protein YeaO (DUF488 family)
VLTRLTPIVATESTLGSNEEERAMAASTTPARTGPEIRLRRVYEPPHATDGRRFLVDRLWPRGVAKADAHLDAWLKEVAPSTELRRWFGHDPARWDEFRRRYRGELADRPEALTPLLAAARLGPITLVYAARDERHNAAIVLRGLLAERLR